MTLHGPFNTLPQEDGWLYLRLKLRKCSYVGYNSSSIVNGCYIFHDDASYKYIIVLAMCIQLAEFVELVVRLVCNVDFEDIVKQDVAKTNVDPDQEVIEIDSNSSSQNLSVQVHQNLSVQVHQNLSFQVLSKQVIRAFELQKAREQVVSQFQQQRSSCQKLCSYKELHH
ncbi:hypothetical protein Tco_0659109 [Tanacetum coccineum]